MALHPQYMKLQADDPLTLSRLAVPGAYIPGGGLQWNVFNSASGVTLHLTGKYFDNARSTIVNLDSTMIPATDRSLSSQYISLGNGYLLSLRVNVTAGTVYRGQCWNVVGVAGVPGATLIDQILVSDYVTTQTECTYPGGIIRQSTEGSGAIVRYQVTTPGAGAEFRYNVPTNSYQRFIGLTATLQTSAAVANRQSRILFTPIALPAVLASETSIAIPASQTVSLFFNIYGSTPNNNLAGAIVGINCPVVFLLPGGRIDSVSDLLNGADQYSSIYINLEEWINV